MQMKLGIAAVAALVIIGIGWVTFSGSDGQTAAGGAADGEVGAESADVTPSGVVHTMTLGEDGYEPQDITIARGDTIEFSTALDGPFWPASNVHPTHRIYSAFDPKKPVPPDETWGFTFGRVGEWRYHDHLKPYHTGIITVTGTTSSAADTQD